MIWRPELREWGLWLTENSRHLGGITPGEANDYRKIADAGFEWPSVLYGGEKRPLVIGPGSGRRVNRRDVAMIGRLRKLGSSPGEGPKGRKLGTFPERVRRGLERTKKDLSTSVNKG